MTAGPSSWNYFSEPRPWPSDSFDIFKFIWPLPVFLLATFSDTAGTNLSAFNRSCMSLSSAVWLADSLIAQAASDVSSGSESLANTMIAAPRRLTVRSITSGYVCTKITQHGVNSIPKHCRRMSVAMFDGNGCPALSNSRNDACQFAINAGTVVPI